MTALAFLADALYDVMLGAVCAYAFAYLAWYAVRFTRRWRKPQPFGPCIRDTRPVPGLPDDGEPLTPEEMAHYLLLMCSPVLAPEPGRSPENGS